MSLTVFSMLLVIYAVVQVIWARAKPVDIFRGAGKSDILQLRNPKKNDTRVYNALYNFSRLKWIATDNDGNIVIPYTITGSYKYYDQFTKVQPFEATTYNVPYDYESVMHYKKDAFALPNKISMETKDPDYQDVIGNQHDASPTDYFKICEIYRCQTCMGILL
ncbi:hypothetical protein GCK32_004348 [Trichostrongylus colubriformis]|uniref:Peptidase M12A domain-containing protein n=1 Tax=Trichostrongylus colubriformis TaxID=6319 RepID=A0AAN8G148_TRICO